MLFLPEKSWMYSQLYCCSHMQVWFLSICLWLWQNAWINVVLINFNRKFYSWIFLVVKLTACLDTQTIDLQHEITNLNYYCGFYNWHWLQPGVPAKRQIHLSHLQSVMSYWCKLYKKTRRPTGREGGVRNSTQDQSVYLFLPYRSFVLLLFTSYIYLSAFYSVIPVTIGANQTVFLRFIRNSASPWQPHLQVESWHAGIDFYIIGDIYDWTSNHI